MDSIETNYNLAIFNQSPAREFASVAPNGTVTINWKVVEEEAADPKAFNRAWAKLLLCARDPSKCGPYE